MKKLVALFLTLAMMLSLCCFGTAFAEAEEAKEVEEEIFADWNEGAPALETLIDYVESVTNESSPDFIPVEDRVAVFDMDGTLCAELCPTYLEYYMLAWRILKDPSYSPDEEMLEFGRMLRDHALDKSFPDHMDMLHATHAAKAYAGMTQQEFTDFVTGLLVRPVDGFTGMSYATSFYTPMIEVVEYLQDYDFQVYVVSGSDRALCRTFIEGIFDIPYDHIIGMDVDYDATNQGDTDGLDYVFQSDDEVLRSDRLIIKNLKMNKVRQIVRDIGKQPVLSFGNSSGDCSMHNYTIFNNPYRSEAFMLVADDDVRDYGSPEKNASLKEKWKDSDYNVISMRDDFRTIYGDNVAKTGEFHWLEMLADDREANPKYTLDKVVVLSRHNIRSPLSGSGSLLGDITPHEWFDWTSNPSELSLRGAMLETQMGQYFRLWLEDEGLFPENYKPEEGEVRFYANSMQRTLATARYFSAGLLPVTVVPIENHAEYNTMDPTFNPALTFLTYEYENDIIAQIAEKGGFAGLKGIHTGLLDAIELLMDVTDMEESKAYQSGQFGNLLEGRTDINLELGKEAGMTGPIKTATSVADALTFQFYEMADDKAAAFGHDLTRDDWVKIHSIVDTYTEMLFGTPLIAVNAAHPLLQEIFSELTTEDRKFSFLCGHDSNIVSVLAALGVEEYELPDTVETKTPIGVKLVFEIWSSEDGESYAKVRLVYQSTDQLRGMTMLSLDNPPMSYDIDLPGLERNSDGFYRLDDVLECFRNAIGAYDVLLERYGDEDAAVSEGSVDFAEVFPSWNPDSASLNELVAFVSDCTDESSEGYLDPADRIATFDMDGTILCEKAPIYFDWCLTFHRVLDDPTYNATEEERAAMEEAREVAYTEGKTFYGDGLSKDDLVATAFAGMTLEEFRSYVLDYADSEDAAGFEGMTYGQSFYKPMIEVINYLKANDFDVWMVSACEREVVRALMERFDFPYDHIVATDVPYVASGKGDEPADEYNMGSDEVLLLGTPLDPVECGKSGKPAAIAREIGKRPVLAFGNSTGDYSMLNYAEGNPAHEGKGFFIVCDDTEREYGSAEKAAGFYAEVEAQGWTAISMANDWATIYGEGVQKTELPGVEAELELAA